MAQLPSSGSIIDYLNSTGKDSSFSSRRKMFNQAGLNKRLGDFTGASNQNLTLLKTLRGGSNQSSPSFFSGQAPPNAQEGNRAAESERQRQYSINNVSGGASDFFKNNSFLQPFGEALTQTSTAARGRQPDQGTPQMGGAQTPKYGGDTISAPGSIPGRNTGMQEGESVQDMVNRLSDPNAGQSRIPEGSTAQSMIDSIGQSGNSYTIQSGDTLGAIAKRFGTTVDELAKNNNISNPDRISAGDVLSIAGGQTGGTSTQSGGSATGTQSPDTPAAVNPETTTGQQDSETFNQLGISASTILGEYTPPSEASLVNEFLNSSEGKLLLEKQELNNQTALAKAETAKQALETKYASEKESLENRLASNGLAFSGIRGTQVKALADSLAASTLGVDRDFATKLLNADIKFRETVLDGVSDLMKEAAADNEDAIKQLNLAGYAVVGDQLVPTLARQNATLDDIRADANLAISQRRLELSEQANARAAAKAAGGTETDKYGEFLQIIAMMNDPANDNVTDPEWESELRGQTDLSAGDINSIIGVRPPSATKMTTDAADLVGAWYDKPTLSRLLPGDQRAEALAKAKEEAIKEVKANRGVIEFEGGNPIELKTSDQINDFTEYINSVTLDDI